MPTVLPMTRVEAYLAYKAGVISESDLKPSLKTNFYSGLENWLAYWCGLTADYPKDEDNNPKWYTEEEYYVAYLCGIAPDYPTNCYRRVGAYLRHIISYRWPQPDKPLTREEYYLSLMQSTVVVNPTPSSDIYLSPTTEGPIKLLGVYGDTTQETLTGKNLFDFNSISALRCSYTRSGNILSVSATGDNPSLTLTFTKPIVAGTYTASSSENIGTATLSPRDVDNSSLNVNFTTSQVPRTMTFSNDAYYLTIYTTYTTGESFTLDFSKFQIESGSTDTSYEPYCGGLPAPNPTFPEPVNVVTGGQTVQIFTTNKFKTSAVVNLACGTNILASDTYRGWYCPVTAGSTYLVSRASTSAPGRFRSCFTQAKPVAGVRCYNEAGVTGYDTHDSDTMFKVTIPAGMTYLFLYLSNSDETITDDMGINVKLAQNFDINLGKNLLDLSVQPTSVNGVTTSYDSATNSLSVASTGSGSGYIYARYDLKTLKPGNTYNIKIGRFTNASVTNERILYVTSYNGSSSTQLLEVKAPALSGTFAVPDDSKEVRVYFYTLLNTTSVFQEVQLEAGSTATAYAPYFDPIELCKIGDYQDYIRKSTGKNLLTLDGIIPTGNQYITYEQLDSNSLKLTALSGIGSYSDKTFKYSLEQLGLKVGDTVSLKMDMAGNYASRQCRVYYNAIPSTVVATLTPTDNAKSFTIPSGTTDILLLFYVANGETPSANSTATYSNIQLELGPTATEYEPYGKVWYKHAEIGKQTYDGSEEWNKLNYCFQTAAPADKGPAFTCLSDHFTYNSMTTAITSNLPNGQFGFNTIKVPTFRNDSIITVDDWKEWLTSHLTSIYYRVQTATNTQITNADLIAQLEAIGHVYAGEGFTALTVVTPEPNLPALLVVSAPKYQ